MKIAKFITSKHSFPYPKGRIFAPYDVADVLTRALIAQGHEVTWFAPKGTKTSAKLVDCDMIASSEDPRWLSFEPVITREIRLWSDSVFLSQLAAQASEFDIIHLDSYSLALPFARLMKGKPVVLTLHNPFDSEFVIEQSRVHRDLPNLHYVSISNNQRLPNPDIQYVKTIYHGLELNKHPWTEKGGDRWIFVARIVPYKGAHIAIEIAKKSGEKLDIIGPNYPDPKNKEYFETQIKPHIDGEQIRYLGSVPRDQLFSYHNPTSKGLLFPLQWEEPFGLTVIESLAAGSPVVAFPKGSMPELIDDGKTGFLPKTVDEAVVAVKKINTISRSHCRYVAEQRFSIDRVVKDYLEVFAQLTK